MAESAWGVRGEGVGRVWGGRTGVGRAWGERGEDLGRAWGACGLVDAAARWRGSSVERAWSGVWEWRRRYGCVCGGCCGGVSATALCPQWATLRWRNRCCSVGAAWGRLEGGVERT